MNTRYKLMNWKFDDVAFANAIIIMLQDFSYAELGELIGVTKSCIHAWAHARYTNEFRHPNLSNLVLVCNTLDLDPRDFFVLVDVV